MIGCQKLLWWPYHNRNKLSLLLNIEHVVLIYTLRYIKKYIE